jgi:hypothetical protein
MCRVPSWLAGIALTGAAAAAASGHVAALGGGEAGAHAVFTLAALNARAPVVREARYLVNARVRPLLLFWTGRDDVGGARITWRAGAGGREALELLVGSDPARTPHAINRWGFIVEEWAGDSADVLGFMKQSNEESLDEAERNVSRPGEATVFKAVRTRIEGRRATSATSSFHAPSDVTYRQLDRVLSLLPVEASSIRTVTVPAGTAHGFLAATAAMMKRSATPGRTGRRNAAASIGAVTYLYDQALYELSMTSCAYRPMLRTRQGDFPQIVDGRFRIRNAETGDATEFAMAYGASPELQDVPVHVVFRPRWWMEVELWLDRAESELP